jgi:hypothetical protein
VKKSLLIGIFILIFFGCGSSDENTPQYKTGDSVFIIKNMRQSMVPLLKKALKGSLKEGPIVFKFKDYKSENCISFGFKFESTKTRKDFIETNFSKGASSTCIIQDYSIGDEVYRGKSGFVMFTRIQ